ncbi:MAG: TatD family hydrolase [Phycisphaerales bacterium]
MIDTHCHLTCPDFAGRLETVLAEALAAQVTGCITISTTPRDALAALVIAQSQPRVWSSAGVHPLYADQGPFDWRILRGCMDSDRCVAWGELGLDNHYPDPSRPVQHAVLEEQLAFIAACARGEHGPPVARPIILHCREAFGDLLPILRRYEMPAQRYVFHCFTGTPADMRALLDFGAFVSFTGVVTYGNAKDVREAARLVPAGRLMVETDAPYLSPEPLRKVRPCTPAMVRHTAEALAALRSVPFEAFHEEINRTAHGFFGIGS